MLNKTEILKRMEGRFRTARKLRDKGLRQAAREMGISATYLCQIEKGVRLGSLMVLDAAATLYCVDANWLLGRTSDTD
jgi:transcriptional regulator with XRE-family HTH domain